MQKAYYAVFRECLDEFRAEYGIPECMVGGPMTLEEAKRSWRVARNMAPSEDAVYCVNEDDDNRVVSADWEREYADELAAARAAARE